MPRVGSAMSEILVEPAQTAALGIDQAARTEQNFPQTDMAATITDETGDVTTAGVQEQTSLQGTLPHLYEAGPSSLIVGLFRGEAPEDHECFGPTSYPWPPPVRTGETQEQTPQGPGAPLNQSASRSESARQLLSDLEASILIKIK